MGFCFFGETKISDFLVFNSKKYGLLGWMTLLKLDINICFLKFLKESVLVIDLHLQASSELRQQGH